MLGGARGPILSSHISSFRLQRLLFPKLPLSRLSRWAPVLLPASSRLPRSSSSSQQPKPASPFFPNTSTARRSLLQFPHAITLSRFPTAPNSCSRSSSVSSITLSRSCSSDSPARASNRSSQSSHFLSRKSLFALISSLSPCFPSNTAAGLLPLLCSLVSSPRSAEGPDLPVLDAPTRRLSKASRSTLPNILQHLHNRATLPFQPSATQLLLSSSSQPKQLYPSSWTFPPTPVHLIISSPSTPQPNASSPLLESSYASPPSCQQPNSSRSVSPKHSSCRHSRKQPSSILAAASSFQFLPRPKHFQPTSTSQPTELSYPEL